MICLKYQLHNIFNKLKMLYVTFQTLLLVSLENSITDDTKNTHHRKTNTFLDFLNII